MSTQIEKRESKALSTSTNLQSWGQHEFTKKEFMVPRLTPTQATSEKAKSGEAKYGEIRDNLRNKCYGDLKTPMDVVPIYASRRWESYEVTGVGTNVSRKYLADKSGPITPENEDLPYREEVTQISYIERNRVIDVFMLVSGEKIPFVMSFKKTGLAIGKQIITQMHMLNAAEGKVPPAYHVILQPVPKASDNGEYIGLSFKMGGPSTPEEIAEAFKWYQSITSGAAKAAEDEIVGEEIPGGPVPF